MTLYEIVNILKKIALDQPNIRSASDGSVYDKMNTNPSVQYDVFHISQTNHQEDFETDYYGLQLFYISRLEDSLEDNRLQIQSIGKEILGNVIRTFCENFSIDYPTITYIPFTQQFNDLTAGVYCNVRLELPKDLVCADDYLAEVVPNSGLKLQDIGITITENGLRVITPGAEYDGIGEIRIKTEVPQVTSKDLIANLQGDYFLIPEGTTKLRVCAFYYAPFSSITIPSSVTEIGASAFERANLEEITVPDTVSTLGTMAFANCINLTAATIPSGLTSIPHYLFSGSALTEITLPTGITSIGVSAFYGCPLTEIVIPSGVTIIYFYAFGECSAITEMTFEGLTPPQLASLSGWSASLGSTDYTFPIYVPCEAVDAYKTAFGEGYAPRIRCKEEQESTEDTANTAIP